MSKNKFALPRLMHFISMLKENYEDIEPMPLDDLYVFEGVKFYGSLARTNASYDYYDEFGVHYYDLPEHSLIRDPAIAYARHCYAVRRELQLQCSG